MTKQTDVIDNPKYRPVLDAGFVGLVDVMGDDAAIDRAARLSYGEGTKTVSEMRTLIRYLTRNHHSSPTEMVETKWHVKAPLFIARQWFRHRTHSANEYSGRYSVMSDECYLPEPEVIQPQSTTNKQGRSGEIDEVSRNGVRWLLNTAFQHSHDIYKVLLGKREKTDFAAGDIPYDPYDASSPLLSDSFDSIARETARIVLPQSNYTEFYWKQNLHNLFHLVKLRADSHAQYEIRVYAEAILELITPVCPIAVEAFIDYRRDAKTLSRMETDLMKTLMNCGVDPHVKLQEMQEDAGTEEAFLERLGMGKREFREFKNVFLVPA